MKLFIDIISTVFANGKLGSPAFCFSILFTVGLWNIFKKCGEKPYYALIPGYKYYILAKCSDCEAKGRIWYVLEIVNIVVDIIMLFVSTDRTSVLVLYVIIETPLDLMFVLYSMQIYINIAEIFNAKKIWVALWIVAPGVPAVLWGVLKAFQPQWKVSDFEQQKEILLSGKQAVIMENGMTVNLEERVVPDFFKKKYLLRDIHMYIKPGHMVLLLGGSGAGKSTFLNAMIGYEKANAEVVLNSGNIYTEYKKMQYEIGFVPQQELMRPKDTVYNTLMDAAALRLPSDFSKEDRKKRVNEVMKMFGLLPVQKSLVEKLSGGQKKRLSIAMEFIPNPSLFVLDEPDSGLDGVMARELMEQLRKIADLGKIVIVITHTPDRVIDLFNDVIVLAKDTNRTGRLAYFGSIEDATEFFGSDSMEKIVMKVNRKEEGGEDRADEFIQKYAEVQHG